MRNFASNWMRAGLALLLLGGPASLLATPVQYQFDLNVSQIGGFTSTHDYFANCAALSSSQSSFACKSDGSGGLTPVQVGDTFSGRFTVDADIASLADGAHVLPYSDFDITVGMIRYSSTVPSAWAGTRGYVGPIIGLGGALGFVVTGGVITSLLGELYSYQDLPCLNFDHYRGAGNWIGYGMGDVMGSYSIQRVPEPGTLAMLLLAVAALTLAMRRRTRAAL